MYMCHRMRPIFPAKFAGFALAVIAKKRNQRRSPRTTRNACGDRLWRWRLGLCHVRGRRCAQCRNGRPDGFMRARNFSGAVIDGGVRDVAYLNRIGFPVYALGIAPSTSVYHCRFEGSNIPLLCDGVEVKPQDIIVADTDGVGVVPRAKAAEVLALAQTLEFNEHSMYAYIEKLKSITVAVKKFGRL
jgi:hypothetical protein